MNTFLIRILNKFRLLTNIHVSLYRKFNGKNIRVPVNKGIGYEFSFPSREPWMSDLLKRIVFAKDDHFIDVGVNIGQTLLQVKSLFPDLKYVGFEPNTVCVQYLDKLIRMNDFNSITILNYALSNTSGKAKLRTYDNDWDSSATIVDNFRSARQFNEQQVAIISGDEILAEKEIHRIRVIKIDVEGSETEVLLGLDHTIDGNQPLIICEVLPSYSESNRERMDKQNQLFSFLRNKKYSVFRIEKDQSNRFTGFSKIYEFPIHKNLKQCDYLFCPASGFQYLTD